MTLLLTAVAVVWLLTLGTILVTRSGHTVSDVIAMAEEGQQQRAAAVRRSQDQIRQRDATVRRQLAEAQQKSASAVAAARTQMQRLNDDLRASRAQVRRERAERRTLVRELQLQARAISSLRSDSLSRLLEADLQGVGDVRALLRRVASIPRLDVTSTRAPLGAARRRLTAMGEQIDEAIDELATITSRERQAGMEDLDRTLRHLTRLRADVAESIALIDRALAGLRRDAR